VTSQVEPGHFSEPIGSKLKRILQNKSVFDENYLPERILHREEQFKRIKELLADVEIGSRPGNMLCTGAFGSGKTLVVKTICKTLPLGCVAVYVNCSEQNTRLRIIRSVLQQLGVNTPESGFPGDYYERRFKEAVSRHRFVILVLDEVDRFTDRKGSESFEFFYALSRLVPNVTTIMLTNRATFETDFSRTMDARVKDTFRWTRIEFPDYDATQLADIVEDRCRLGLTSEAYDRGICGLIAASAYKRGGRARGALALACKSAEIADSLRHDRIAENDVREAAIRLKQEQGQETIRMLPPIERKILGFILVNRPTGQAAYNWFVSVAPEHEAGTSLASFYDYLNKLDTLNLIEKEKHGRGRGRGLKMTLCVPSRIEDTVRLSLESMPSCDTPLPSAENVTEPEIV